MSNGRKSTFLRENKEVIDLILEEDSSFQKLIDDFRNHSNSIQNAGKFENTSEMKRKKCVAKNKILEKIREFTKLQTCH